MLETTVQTPNPTQIDVVPELASATIELPDRIDETTVRRLMALGAELERNGQKPWLVEVEMRYPTLFSRMASVSVFPELAR